MPVAAAETRSDTKKDEPNKTDAKKARPPRKPIPRRGDAKKDDEAKKADKFKGLAFRGIGPAMIRTRHRCRRGPEQQRDPVRDRSLRERLEDGQRRDDVDADLRRPGVVLDRLRDDRSQKLR